MTGAVLDASALLATPLGEAGSDRVEAILAASAVTADRAWSRVARFAGVTIEVIR